jgi:hypothetical protein
LKIFEAGARAQIRKRLIRDGRFRKCDGAQAGQSLKTSDACVVKIPVVFKARFPQVREVGEAPQTVFREERKFHGIQRLQFVQVLDVQETSVGDLGSAGRIRSNNEPDSLDAPQVVQLRHVGIRCHDPD